MVAGQLGGGVQTKKREQKKVGLDTNSKKYQTLTISVTKYSAIDGTET